MAELHSLPDFFQAYVPDPPHPAAALSRSVIVVAVAEYLPRAMAWPFNATVYAPPLASVRTHFPLSSEGLLIVVVYVPATPPAASATDETARATTTTAARTNRFGLLNLIAHLPLRSPSHGGSVRNEGADRERPGRCPGTTDVGCAKGTVSDRSARVPVGLFSPMTTPSTSRDSAYQAAGRASTPRGSGFGPRSRRRADARPPGRRPRASRGSRGRPPPAASRRG